MFIVGGDGSIDQYDDDDDDGGGWIDPSRQKKLDGWISMA